FSITKKNVNSSNSKQRSNSTNSSEKFISSRNEETIVSNSHLVSINDFDKELIFNSVHDDQVINSGDMNDDEDNDSNDDKSQLNAFDAWDDHLKHRKITSSPGSSDDDFQEVIHTLKRAYKKNLKPNNIIDEVNMLKPTYDVSPTEFDQFIIRAVFLLSLEKKLTDPKNQINGMQ
ncbi:unnamed protein product, partial [Rotaria sp. Silwood2]